MITLRPYQQTDVERIRAAYRAGTRSLLYVAPTGSGKTVLFAHITEGAASKGKRVLVLVHLGRADVFVALIIIGREIAISALREWMAQIGASKSVAVHMIGKLKTVVQMVAIPFLLFNGVLFGLIDTHVWGVWLIWVAAVMTVWSMIYYLRKALPEIRARAK